MSLVQRQTPKEIGKNFIGLMLVTAPLTQPELKQSGELDRYRERGF